jgi:hypothetical protein
LYLIGKLPFSDDLTGEMQEHPDVSSLWRGERCSDVNVSKEGWYALRSNKKFPLFFPLLA